VNIGRLMLSWLALTNQPVHDLYTVAAGLYICWLCARLAMLAREWAQKGWTYVKKLFGAVFWLIMRIVAASIPLLVIIPFMLGFYFQMLVISPLRVVNFYFN
jgi:E3 ubiquitin-protein ligase MARCH6